LSDFVAVNLEPGEPSTRKRSRPLWDVLHPEDAKATWRELPSLFAGSIALVWAAGRRTFLLTACCRSRQASPLVCSSSRRSTRSKRSWEPAEANRSPQSSRPFRSWSA
jgi:hypothetical protein